MIDRPKERERERERERKRESEREKVGVNKWFSKKDTEGSGRLLEEGLGPRRDFFLRNFCFAFFQLPSSFFSLKSISSFLFFRIENKFRKSHNGLTACWLLSGFLWPKEDWKRRKVKRKKTGKDWTENWFAFISWKSASASIEKWLSKEENWSKK